MKKQKVKGIDVKIVPLTEFYGAKPKKKLTREDKEKIESIKVQISNKEDRTR